jgi:hypothetical protein
MEQDGGATEDETTGGEAEFQEDPSLLRLSIDQVHRINARRMKYIGLYLIWFAAQAYWLLASSPPGYAVVIAASVVLFMFYILFYSVLRAMAYPILLILAVFFMAFFPIPGLIIVVMVDRSISKVLRKGIEDAEAALAAAKANDAT